MFPEHIFFFPISRTGGVVFAQTLLPCVLQLNIYSYQLTELKKILDLISCSSIFLYWPTFQCCLTWGWSINLQSALYETLLCLLQLWYCNSDLVGLHQQNIVVFFSVHRSAPIQVQLVVEISPILHGNQECWTLRVLETKNHLTDSELAEDVERVEVRWWRRLLFDDTAS